MCQIVRNFALVDADGCRVLICDRDAQWSRAVRARFQDAGIRVVRTPYRAPNANAYAERFVRSIKEECLSRLIPLAMIVSDKFPDSPPVMVLARRIKRFRHSL